MPDQKGFIRSSLLYILAAIAIWYMYRSHKEGQIHNDLAAMLNDCRRITGTVQMTPDDKGQLEKAYSTIEEISMKYKLSIPNIKL